MTTKHEWSDAPAWANFLAHDIDGWWIWYECEPTFYADGSWYSRHRSLLVDKQVGDAVIEKRGQDMNRDTVVTLHPSSNLVVTAETKQKDDGSLMVRYRAIDPLAVSAQFKRFSDERDVQEEDDEGDEPCP